MCLYDFLCVLGCNLLAIVTGLPGICEIDCALGLEGHASSAGLVWALEYHTLILIS